MKSEKSFPTYSIIIDKKQTIRGIQSEFNKYFPFLKLEFFRDKIKKGSHVPGNLPIVTNEIIGSLQHKRCFGTISFTKKTTVNDLENSFLNDYDLHAQVFRKSGNIWLVTTSTDDWTLEQQNDEGESLAKHLNTDDENIEDHDIY